MIKPSEFFESLKSLGISFFTGVPDSLLKDFCAYVTDNTSAHNHVITANEGSAIALGAGYHIATNSIPLIYMQNSGLGNAVNPLMSLVDKEVYSIPMILLIGWRGEPGVKDEPQHIKQGRITPDILQSMEIPFQIIDKNSDYNLVVQNSIRIAQESSAPVAILVKKGSFDSYKLKQSDDNNSSQLAREDALEEVLKYVPTDAVIVSTTGMLSRELFELREKNNQSHETDFLTVGCMGHTLQIALGIALAKPDKPVYCFDGDGSAIMHLGNYVISSGLAPKNLKIVVFNNGAHDSVGGQPTAGQWLNFTKVADALNIKIFGVLQDTDEISSILPNLAKYNELALLEVKIKKGARKDLGRPTSTPLQNKELLKSFIQN